MYIVIINSDCWICNLLAYFTLKCKMYANCLKYQGQTNQEITLQCYLCFDLFVKTLTLCLQINKLCHYTKYMLVGVVYMVCCLIHSQIPNGCVRMNIYEHHYSEFLLRHCSLQICTCSHYDTLEMNKRNKQCTKNKTFNCSYSNNEYCANWKIATFNSPSFSRLKFLTYFAVYHEESKTK